MKFSVKNLGPIQEGTISFEKPLTVLVGPNSSGKSYVTYLVFGLIRQDFDYDKIDKAIQLNLDDYIKNKEHEVYTADLAEIFKKHYNQMVEYTLRTINENLSRYFASNIVKPTIDLSSFKENLKEFQENRTWDGTDDEYNKNIYVKNSIFEYKKWKSEGDVQEPLGVYKSKGYDNEMRNDFKKHIKFFIYFFILESIRPVGLNSKTVFFPAERLALSMLSGSVVENKSKQLDEINELLLNDKLDDRGAMNLLSQIKEKNKQTSKYPLAISDHIYFINGLEHTKNQISPYASFAQEIETMLLRGKVVVDSYGGINFQPEASEQAIGIHISSSLVKSLAALVLYFRHTAKKGDTIIIDEPEVNLHPDNQRIVARILAKAIKLGFRLIVSTHSDYIIRELNNLILLDSIYEDTASQEEILKEYRSKGYDESTRLNKDDLAVYYFIDNTIKALPVNEYGFEVSSIDNEVHKLNEATDDFYAKLRELES